MSPRLLSLTTAVMLFATSCLHKEKPHTYIIGFSQCTDDSWRKAMVEGMQRELSFHPHLKFVFKQANGNSAKQIQQVGELVDAGIDLLIISPNEAEPLTTTVEEVFSRGIPVVVLDRKINSKLYSAFIGSDNFEIGRQAGNYAANLLNGKGQILEITGLPASSPAIERHNGFIYSLRTYPDIKIVKTINGLWVKHIAQENLQKQLSSADKIDLVYAHNDEMGLGVYEVFKAKNLAVPKIIGVDGLPGNGGGMDFVSEKILTATMLYITGGEESIQVASKILGKEDYRKNTYLQTSVVDSTNVRLFQLQAGKVAGQQKEIERQQNKMSNLQRIYNNQRTFLYILVSTLALAIIFGGVAFYSLRENRKINKKLNLKNAEISHQRNQLIEMSAQAQLASEARVNFFTNISHEFRTPLTLILGPLEDMMSNLKIVTPANLEMMHKNAMRLMRMVNQLIDFRKIEVDKMKIKARETDMVEFISEIVDSYKISTKKRNIDIRLITRERFLKLWFDANLLDKVIFNLISNALKFTGDNGFINVYLIKDEELNRAVIKIEDNGAGITKEDQEHVFELFYQAPNAQHNLSSGIGLSLSQQFIQLHQGKINVTSEKWKGSVFTVELPLGNDHLSSEEMLDDQHSPSLKTERDFRYLLEHEPAIVQNPSDTTKGKEHSILIIEDNAELRNFLSVRLGTNYEIFEAADGEMAIQQAFTNIPDLIICDIILPLKDGLELTRIFKTDIKTSHIPVMLLTAKMNMEQQIQGMKHMADAYITKPFNVTFLDETIRSLLTNRNRLKEHFSSDVTGLIKTNSISKLDKRFLNEFTTFVELNIANENLNVEEICRNLRVSKMQLYRKIKALLGMNINDYILNTRLKKARYMLQHEDLSISEISYQVGFSSPGYFSTVFKSKFNVSPKEFKSTPQ